MEKLNFKNIETKYKKDNDIIGYEFWYNSSYQGYAKKNIINKEFVGYKIYSIYNTKLYEEFIPNDYIYYFNFKSHLIIFNTQKECVYVVDQESKKVINKKDFNLIK